MKNTKILIADDHHLVAESLSLLLASVSGFEIVGITNNGWQALSFVEKNAVDIVLTDYHMPFLNGIEMTIRMKAVSPHTKCIILTMSEEADHIKEALKVGVYGYVMKSAEKPELVRAIQSVALGDKYFSESVVKKLAEIPEYNSPNGKTRVEDVIPLTKREIEILRLVSEDLSNIEIGKRLFISSTTVETHRRNLMKKLGVSTAIGLMRWGLKHGIVEGV
ncbi:DNA-binding response regulator, NarL/FixJ family, contains REC and HTH domains [Spirosomataceae bacterium TFI 002]|nr:DNA-binding response regulator, NarL/FixJ family, contains REC and HTH domains [Spirosomataceae bacterium TFI 002]